MFDLQKIQALAKDASPWEHVDPFFERGLFDHDRRFFKEARAFAGWAARTLSEQSERVARLEEHLKHALDREAVLSREVAELHQDRALHIELLVESADAVTRAAFCLAKSRDVELARRIAAVVTDARRTSPEILLADSNPDADPRRSILDGAR